jgi:hypothetical protein
MRNVPHRMTLLSASLVACLASTSLSQYAAADTGPQLPATTPGLSPAASQGLEAIAYSEAVQALIFTYPLVIVERERVQRATINTLGAGSNPLVAPINQFGHMRRLVTSAIKNLPISPNNDTVYSGALLDLKEQPIILRTPDVLDRFITVEVSDAYIENAPYLVSSRVNGGRAATIAFVGPNWHGKLPPGMQEQRMPTDIGIIALRIRVDNDADLPIIRGYQDKMSLTALSDWKNGPSATPPKASATRPRGEYTDEFAYFRRLAELLTESPPGAKDAAEVAVMEHIGLKAGKPFNPDVLSPEARTGLLRALKDSPAIIDAFRYSRGVETPNHWRTNPGGGRYGYNYVARAEMALVGLVQNDNEEATYRQTFLDGDGAQLNGKNNYVLHLTAAEIPKLGHNGFWSITMYDAYAFQFVANPINRFKLGSHDKLKYNKDGSLDIYIQAKSPGADLETNWLPAPEDKDFKTTIRIYSPGEGEWKMERHNQFPGIRKVAATQ